jgi:hypothetical protein
MSLQEFLDSGRLKPHKATAEEIGKLFDVVKRDLADTHVKGLSKDRRLTIAYNAAGQGHHQTVFMALRKLMDAEHHHVLDYLDDCRSKRNLAEYLGTEVASEQEVEELVREAKKFSSLLHDLISKRHPRLIK